MSLERRLDKLERIAPPHPTENADLTAEIAAAMALPTEEQRCTAALRVYRRQLERRGGPGPDSDEGYEELCALTREELLRRYLEAGLEPAGPRLAET